jgi:nicotinamidase-related amidase
VHTLSTHDSMLLVVDMQSALLPAIQDSEAFVLRAVRLATAAQLLGVPVIATEHCADKIGATTEVLRPLIDHVIPKTHFDATRATDFLAELPKGRHDVLVIGAEAHVCVLQTGMGLSRLGLSPLLVTDCIGSRRSADRDATIERWRHFKLESITAEMAMFEWLGSANHPQFKEVIALIKAG